MKHVTSKMFFTVLWRGLCQALGKFFGLFGYKRDGKFAKYVWGQFATCAAVVMLIIASAFVCALGYEGYRWYNGQHYSCDNQYCYENIHVSREIYFLNHDDGKGYIYNIRTGEKFVRNVAWIAKPLGKDSLICFSNGKKRGYFSKNTGKVVIEPKYDHAWIFSDGLASVEEGGRIKFIDATGETVIDKDMAYIPNMEGYVFHGGYCVIDTNDGELCGLMDRAGKIVLPLEYDDISVNNTFEIWTVRKGKEMAALDSSLQPILPLTECKIYTWASTIDVTMPNHTIRKYDYQGALLNDFYVTSVRSLEYDTDETVYYKTTSVTTDEDGEAQTWENMDSYHPSATARLRVYVAGDGYEGLMDANGHIITMPEYKNIEAIGSDLYLCDVSNGDNLILNGHGKIVR